MEERTQTAKRLRLVGLILGIIGAVAGLPVSFFVVMGNIQSSWSLELGYVVFSWLGHWAILLVACRWAFVGGVLLILDSSLLAIFVGDEVLAGLFRLPLPPFLDALVLGLLLFIFLSLLASGILFILSWREGRKYPEPST